MSGTHPLDYQRLQIEIQNQFEDHFSIYTDGCKDQSQVAAVAVCQRNKFGICIPEQSSTFTAEAHALFLALEISNYTKYIVYSDLFSCLQAIAMFKTNHPFMATVIYKMNQLATAGYDIHLCWVPGHAGIQGNKRADQAAKKALNCDVEQCVKPHSDLINQSINQPDI